MRTQGAARRSGIFIFGPRFCAFGPRFCALFKAREEWKSNEENAATTRIKLELRKCIDKKISVSFISFLH